ncbi:MAG: hypothetical protein DDG58_11915 [Ardenticatenia bacterium]|nr:MAG: hypothetical protein DDG58_11915 [Ardenticatenia bacterium]
MFGRAFEPDVSKAVNARDIIAHLRQNEKVGTVRAPGDRYPVIEAVWTKDGAPHIYGVWKQLHQEKHCLWSNGLIGKDTRCIW